MAVRLRHELHGFTVVRATTSLRGFKEEVELDHTENAVYHEEPYEIACEIAGVECEYGGEQWTQYQHIRAKYFPSARTSPTK